MKRSATALAALACALCLPAGAQAASARPTHEATGTVTNIGYANFTIETGGRPMGVVNALIARAGAITRADYPYVWGGGHAEAGVASIGIPGGPGYNGHRVGFDCSGSVAAVLAGAGLWPAGGGVPSDAGVIQELLAQHLIARGAGVGPTEVTLYDDPGVHIFMNIDGRFFGTSDGGGGGDRKGGPGWLDDSAYDATDRAFKQYHVLPTVLREQTGDAHALTFQLGQDPVLVDGFADGEKVNVGYTDASNGTMVARTIGFYGLRSATGTITAIGRHSVTVQRTSGSVTLTFARVPEGLLVGDTVSVTYTRADAVNTLRSISVTATPPVTPPPTTPPSPSSTGGAGIGQAAHPAVGGSGWTGWGGWARGARRGAARASVRPAGAVAAG